MDREILEIFSLIQGIVSIVMIIVFFIMSGNISKLKKQLVPSTSEDDLIAEAKKQIFCGNNEKAIALYHQAAFVIKNQNNYPVDYKKKMLKGIAQDITECGGVVSKPLIKWVADNCK